MRGLISFMMSIMLSYRSMEFMNEEISGRAA